MAAIAAKVFYLLFSTSLIVGRSARVSGKLGRLAPRLQIDILGTARTANSFASQPTKSEKQSMEPKPDASLRDFQRLIHTMYYEKDLERGVSGTFMWLMEEVGELASALRTGHDRQNLEEEFADVIAWLTTIANVAGVDLSDALQKKYGSGCPGCGRFACECPFSEKP